MESLYDLPQTKRGIVSKRQLYIDTTIGERYYKLVVISYSNEPGIIYRWLCRCDCGETTTARLTDLKLGRKRTCGKCVPQAWARSQQRGKKTNRPAHNKKIDASHAAAYRVYDSYRQHSKRAARIFNITFEQFRSVAQQDCFYCGLCPSQTIVYRDSSFTYTGIDRIDSSKGYIEGNMRPCCKRCNIAKGDLSEQQFMEWLARAYKHMEKVRQEDE